MFTSPSSSRTVATTMGNVVLDQTGQMGPGAVCAGSCMEGI
jgi:hypothetical protein